LSSHETSSWFFGTAGGEEALQVYSDGIAAAGVAAAVQAPRLEESLGCGKIYWTPWIYIVIYN